MSMQTGDVVVGQTELTRADVRAYQRHGQWHEALGLTAALTVAGGCLGGAFINALPDAPVAAGFVAVAFVCQLVFQWWQRHLNSSAPSGPARYTADGYGFTVEWPGLQSKMAWSRMVRFAETEQYFFLGVRPLQGYMVPKRAFASSANIDRFRQLAQQRPGERLLDS